MSEQTWEDAQDGRAERLVVPARDLCADNPKGRHCFCVSSSFQHAVPNHVDMECCWCGSAKCVHLDVQRVPGHGPFRTRTVRS